MRARGSSWILAALIAFPLLVLHAENEGVTDDQLGLSKTDVRDTPNPIVATSAAKDPGENSPLGAYAPSAPPLIPHRVADFLPITIEQNLCADCHDLRERIGAEREPGEPTPMPRTHYTDLRHHPGEAGETLSGSRYVCTLCHVPQADVKPLVGNRYGRS